MTIPNFLVIGGTGFEKIDKGNDANGNRETWQFRDPECDTNLRLTTHDGFSWELRDGRSSELHRKYWEGRLHTSKEITRLLILYGGKQIETQPEIVEFEITVEDGVMRSSEPIFDGRPASDFFWATEANETWRVKGERHGEGIRITEAARVDNL